MVFHHTRPTIVSASTDGVIKFWDYESKKACEVSTGHFHSVCYSYSTPSYLFYSPYCQFLIQTISLCAHVNTVTGLIVPCNEDFLISASEDHRILIWSVKKGVVLYEYRYVHLHSVPNLLCFEVEELAGRGID